MEKNTKRVGLFGTCNDSKWRDELIPQLTCDYFNPVVDDWNEEAYKEELKQRETCDYCLYVITPKMKGVYSIAEVIDDSNKRPEKTLFFIQETDKFSEIEKRNIFFKEATYMDLNALEVAFTSVKNFMIPFFDKEQLKSLNKVGEMVDKNGGKWFKTKEDLIIFLNENT